MDPSQRFRDMLKKEKEMKAAIRKGEYISQPEWDLKEKDRRMRNNDDHDDDEEEFSLFADVVCLCHHVTKDFDLLNYRLYGV